MKLLINTPLKYSMTFDPDIAEEDWEEWKQFWDDATVFLKFCCIYHTLHLMESGFSFEIGVQKCCLDEQNVNQFFGDILNIFDNKVTIEYAGLGGYGCDFALILTQPEYKVIKHAEVVQFLVDNDVKIDNSTDCLKKLKQLIKDIKRENYCNGYDEDCKHSSNTILDN
jgi:hypothetical protein